MNLFTRLAELVTVNFHALLDRVEDPERMLTHVLRTMEAGLDATRQHAARAIAAERGLGRELDQQRAAADGWARRARLAMNLGREDLARRALAHKIEHDDVIAALLVQHAAAQRLSTDVRSAFRRLQFRVAECHRRQKLLVARNQAAHVRLDLERTLGQQLGVLEATPTLDRFEQLARRLTDLEDQALAQVELGHQDAALQSEFDTVEMTKRIDEELAILKRDAT